MIEIKTYNEKREGKILCYDTEIHISGDDEFVLNQLISIFDKIYEAQPKLFEAVLLNCKYTEDHT